MAFAVWRLKINKSVLLCFIEDNRMTKQKLTIK